MVCERWGEVYPDDKGLFWCVWTDKDRAGHVYFARVGGVPDWVKAANPACGAGDDEQPRVPVVPPEYRRLKVETTAPYRQANHIHFVGGQAVVAGRELEPEYEYALVYESADGNRVTLANRVTTDGYGNFSQMVNTPDWLLHADWGTIETVPLGGKYWVDPGQPDTVDAPPAVEPAQARVARLRVTADC